MLSGRRTTNRTHSSYNGSPASYVWPTGLFGLACSIGSMVFQNWICLSALKKWKFTHSDPDFWFPWKQSSFAVPSPCPHVAVRSLLYPRNICPAGMGQVLLALPQSPPYCLSSWGRALVDADFPTVERHHSIISPA